MSVEEPVRVETSGGLVTITLDRPPLNVLDVGALAVLNNTLETTFAAPDTGVVLIRGEGKAFCAGLDVADHTPERVGEMMAAFRGMFEKLARTDVPTIAAVHGAALGGGMELATCCDVILASERAKFGQPEIKLGVFPPLAAAVLPHLCGLSRALDLILSGRTIPAAEARACGLVSQVFPAEGFDDHVAEYVTQLTALSRPVLRTAKRATLQDLRPVAERRYAEAERVYMDELMKLADAKEGIASFMEKRAPSWRHA